jgi:anti-repressor protein
MIAGDWGGPIRYIGTVDAPTQLVGPNDPAMFSFDGCELRLIMVDGDPWFVAADAALALGYRDGPSAIRKLRPNQKGAQPVCTPGGTQSMAVVSESGLYHLIMRSKRPDAERFQDWVTDEVLPAIRKTGSYTVQHLAPAGIIVPRTLPEALRAYADEVEARERAEVRASVAEGQAIVLVERVEVLEPKAAQADHHRAADGLRSLRDFANEVSAWAMREHKVRVLQQEVFDFLAEIGLLIRGNTNRHNQPTKMAGDRDFVKVKVGERKSNSSPSGTKATKTSRLTPAGEGWAWDRIHKRITEHGSLRKPPATFALENRSSD